MYENQARLSTALKQAHERTWETIASPGAFFTARQRIEMVHTAREALDCELCMSRKRALSPYKDNGEHQHATELSTAVVEAVHRIRTDPGRLTQHWAQEIIAAIGAAEYVELVSVVTSSVIVDTLHNALGLGVPKLPLAKRGTPHQEVNSSAVDAGAWVPILDAPVEMSDTGLPRVPNIARSLGLVPSALDLFFSTFRPHYALKDIDLSISQGQAEFVAARVSALNECFY